MTCADTDLDDSDDDNSAAPFSLQPQRQAVVTESWGVTSTTDASTSAPATTAAAAPVSTSAPAVASTQQDVSSTQWQTHWLELRIHVLKQQQQHYEVRLEQLQHQQQASQPAASPSPPAQPIPLCQAGLPLSSADQLAQAANQQVRAPLSAPHQQAPASLSASHRQDSAPTMLIHQSSHLASLHPPVQAAPSASQAPDAAQPAQIHIPAFQEPAVNASAGLVSEPTPGQHQQAAAVQKRKRRHARQPVPGLSIPEIARHPFFAQHNAAGSDGTAEMLASEGELTCSC